MERYSLDRQHVNRLPKDDVLAELRRVAAKMGNRRFSRREFDRHTKRCKGSAVLKNFGTWDEALRATGLELALHRTQRTQITNAQLLDELGRVWRMLEHKPSKGEWDSVDTKYSYTTCKQRFGGWLNACVAFVEGAPTAGTSVNGPDKVPPQTDQAQEISVPTNLRYVPLKLRLNVLQRDRFCCVMDGRNLSLEPGVQLHVDHVIPFSRGGRTTLDNLQTLCRDRNLGKGSIEDWQKGDLERDKKFVAEKKLTEGTDEVFVNGDSFILNARALEPVFKAKMFTEVHSHERENRYSQKEDCRVLPT